MVKRNKRYIPTLANDGHHISCYVLRDSLTGRFVSRNKECVNPQRCRQQATCVGCYFYKPIVQGILHTHIWDNETPARLYSHSHTRGDIPHGHHGSRYWKIEEQK